MSRTVRFEVPVDTSLFTPLQLQPRAAFGVAMSAWARWLREHWVAFPRLIADEGLAVVIAGMQLEHARPFGFFDADALEADIAARVRADGGLLFLTVGFSAGCGGEEVARIDAVLRPVRIGDGLTLAARPANLGADVLACFEDDEIVAEGSRVRLRSLVSNLEAASAPLAASCRTFTIHRHLCETADQWSGIALPDLTGEVRERLVSQYMDDIGSLASAFVQPMRRLALEFRRPAFFLDDVTVACRAFERDDELLFVHRFASTDDATLATCIEWFPVCGEPAASGSVRDGGGNA